MEENPKSPFLIFFEKYLSKFKKVDSVLDADVTLSTEAMYNSMQEIYPSESYSSESIFNALLNLGYEFETLGEGTIVWLIAKKV